MLPFACREALCICVLLLCIMSAGCTAHPAHGSAEAASLLHEIAQSGRLNELDRPAFPDYRLYFQQIYEASGYRPIWTTSGKPTPQALDVIQALKTSDRKGLNPADYDASRWQERLRQIAATPKNDEAVARLDAALTICAMRYISDLHVGRVNPRHFHFGIDIQHKKYDLPQFLTERLIHAPDARPALAGVEPAYPGYQRTEVALQRYLRLAEGGDGPKVPATTNALAPGGAFPGIQQLAQRLKLLGDLPPDTIVEENSTYSGALVEAVKHFQARHGLDSDGKLNKKTIQELNVPLAARVRQLQDALERWRWLPLEFPEPVIVVNIPEFMLRVFSPDHKIALRMSVVVGRAMRTQTPVFTGKVDYLVFRPYWNVPRSIIRNEILPNVARNQNYIENKRFEVTTHDGKVISSGVISDSILEELRTGKLTIRQKPGPANSLGLVKFIFPNTHDVYLHDTPATQLFSQSRRDFSHGCIRVQKPAELAAYLLRKQPDWDRAAVERAMRSGPDNRRVTLTTPVPVLIFYVTAVVEEDGSVHFFDDIYGFDKRLEDVLARGIPYPG